MSDMVTKALEQVRANRAASLPIYVVLSGRSPNFYSGALDFDDPEVNFLHFSFDSEECARKAKDLRADVFKRLGQMGFASDSQVDAWMTYRETIRVERYIIRPAMGDE